MILSRRRSCWRAIQTSMRPLPIWSKQRELSCHFTPSEGILTPRSDSAKASRSGISLFVYLATFRSRKVRRTCDAQWRPPVCTARLAARTIGARCRRSEPAHRTARGAVEADEMFAGASATATGRPQPSTCGASRVRPSAHPFPVASRLPGSARSRRTWTGQSPSRTHEHRR